MRARAGRVAFEASSPIFLGAVRPTPSSALSGASLNALCRKFRLGFPPTLRTFTITSFNQTTRAKTGRRIGIKGEGCLMVSLSPEFGDEIGGSGL